MFHVANLRQPPRLFLAKATKRMTNCAAVAWQMLSHPAEAVRYIKDQRDGRTPLAQGLPYFSYCAIDYLRQNLKPGTRVFEFGGGGSTIFFLNLGCEVTSVETSPEWMGILKKAVGPHPHWHLIEHCSDDPVKNRVEFPAIVLRDAPWDVVVVDNTETESLHREAAAIQAIKGIRPGGLLVFDDAYLPKYEGIPKVMAGWHRQSFRGLGTARAWVTMTDIYTAPGRPG